MQITTAKPEKVRAANSLVQFDLPVEEILDSEFQSEASQMSLNLQ